MELVATDLDRSEAGVPHNQALGIVSVFEFATNPQATRRLGNGDQVDDDLMAVRAPPRHHSQQAEIDAVGAQCIPLGMAPMPRRIDNNPLPRTPRGREPFGLV